jgi:hypothetical protein
MFGRAAFLFFISPGPPSSALCMYPGPRARRAPIFTPSLFVSGLRTLVPTECV